MGGRFSSGAGRIALGGVLAAGSVAVMWLASIIPSGQVGVTAAAGLFPVAAVLAGGRATGYLCWAVSSLLGLLLLPDKGAALMYLCFLGLYPVTKSRLESLKSRVAEWIGKLVFFNAALTILWVMFRDLFFPALPAWLSGNIWILYGVGNVVFIVYDIALSRLIGALILRLGPKRRR